MKKRVISGKKCRFCSSTRTVKVIDFGNVGLAGGFLLPENFKEEKKHPQQLYFCEDCFLLQIINKDAIIVVNFVRKVLTDLDDVKLSCETPKPKAPPSDLCNKTTITKIIASIIFITTIIFSMMLIYSNFLLYQ